MLVFKYLNQRVRRIGEPNGKSFKGISKTNKKKHTWRDLSFITQFNIEFLLPLTVAEKCLEKCLKLFNLCLLIFLLIKSLKIGYTTESFLQNEVVNFLHLIVMANLSHTTLIKLLSWG